MDVYVDGHFVPAEEARISVFDHGFLYGDGVFEGIRVYEGNVFRLQQHVQRLYHTVSRRGLPNQLGLDPRLCRHDGVQVSLHATSVATA